MPEGPEAAYLAETINKEIQGTGASPALVAADIVHGRYSTVTGHGPPQLWTEFQAALPLKFESFEHKGKVIVLRFAGNWSLLFHLGLTGWFYTKRPPTWRKTTPDIVFTFSSSPTMTLTLTFTDQRRFGTMTVCNSKEALDALLDQIAPDIGDKRHTTWAVFKKRLDINLNAKKAMTRKPIEEVLVDQKLLVSGIGNYLKAEALYAAKIAPQRLVSTITDAEWRAIFDAAQEIHHRMTKLMKQEKTTPGSYEEGMAVYGRLEDPLGNPVETYKNKAGRTTHWVPGVQE